MLCGNTEFEPYQNGRLGVHIDCCKKCGLVFTNPQPGMEDLAGRYEGDYYEHWLKPLQQKRRQRLWKRRLARVRHFASGTRLLDVGCGDGLFLRTARDAGYEVTGTEISEAAVQIAMDRHGLNVQHGLLPDCKLKEASFDIITLWHSLEHMPDPEASLHTAHSLLKPGGHVVIAVPNVNDRLGQEFYKYVKGRYMPIYTTDSKEPHLFHFSNHTLRRLVTKCDFKVDYCGVDFCQVDPYWRVIEHMSWVVSWIWRPRLYLANLAVGRR